MSKKFVVVHEAQADFTTATELADRVLVAKVDWLDETLLDSQRQWVDKDHSGFRLTWQSIPSKARALGIQVRGQFDGTPALPDAKAARRALAYVLKLFETVDAVLLIRDMDDQIERRQGLEQARTSYSSVVRTILGVAIPERESWVISGFEATNDEEQRRLESEIKRLGSNPCLRSHELTAGKDDLATRSPKRVLAALLDDHWERQRKCWHATSLTVLEARGRENGLADYLKEITELLIPLITGQERSRTQP